MQKFIFVICFVAVAITSARAQSRKQTAHFSQYQHYYNPSLTGFEGGALKTLYRNQWTGFEDAPKTLLASAEFDLNGIRVKRKGYQLNKPSHDLDYFKSISAKHALGITLMHDQFGPAKETQVALSYGSGVRLSEKLSLRWGTAVTYSSHRLDGNSLTVDQESDPKYLNLLGHNNRMSKADLNLGLALSAAKFYVGYAIQDVTKGKLLSGGDDYLRDFYAIKHIAQAGYRTSITDQFGVTVNTIYQYDSNEAATIEGQLKAVYQDMFWAGGGYRSNQAYSFLGGIRLNQLSIHYAYESPVQDARYISKSTNEVAITYSLKQKETAKNRKQITLW
ncbi:PorP/SprF family type IX secretion system membrane protein [uncultured Pontibacter sp.]|uniref:PorP/SprF family type IX secretion system membrane protein n=1 Tax=uncultured Pontibacter sp. TaxID=453356 RepID=UPI00261A7736|nr:PorP/SprF family type IX secretion system membrane protein [uncultured Pontibacter sp.]